MKSDITIYPSIISGLTEVILTHPIDYMKTISQKINPKKMILSKHLRNSYQGLESRIIGIVPIRILFWNSIDYFKNNGYNIYQSSVLTSIIQTTIDYPVEQIKTQKIINNLPFYNSFSNVNILKASSIHLVRNIGFTLSLCSIIQINPDSLYYGAVGGLIGSLITHPLDTLKTWYQSGQQNYPVHWNFRNYIQGWKYRCSLNLISMNIGWVIFHRLNNNKKIFSL